MEKFRIVDPILPDPEEFLKYYSLSQGERHYSNQGPCVRLLESRFADLLDCNVVTCNNATTGLSAAIVALGRESEFDCVAMSDFTYVATACAITATGYEIIPCDINDEYAIDVDSNRLRYFDGLICVTCPFGSIPFKTINDLKIRYPQCKILVDAAATIGLPWDQIKLLIKLADVVVFSMHATKTFGIGEGGLIASKNTTLAADIRDYLCFGIIRRSLSHKDEEGVNGKMPEISAAVALAKLDRFDEDNNRRIDKALDFISDIMVDGLELYSFEHTFQVLPFRAQHAYRLGSVLSLHKIPFRKYYDAPLGSFKFKNSKRAYEENICLPFSENMTTEQINELKKALKLYATLGE